MAKHFIVEFDLTENDIERHARLSHSRQFHFTYDYQTARRRGYRLHLFMLSAFMVIIIYASFISKPRIWTFAVGLAVLMLWSAYRTWVKRKAFDERMAGMEGHKLPKPGRVKLGITDGYLYDYSGDEVFKIDSSEVKGVEEDESFFTITLTDKFYFIIPKKKLSFSQLMNVRIHLRSLTNFLEIEYYSNEDK